LFNVFSFEFIIIICTILGTRVQTNGSNGRS